MSFDVTPAGGAPPPPASRPRQLEIPRGALVVGTLAVLLVAGLVVSSGSAPDREAPRQAPALSTEEPSTRPASSYRMGQPFDNGGWTVTVVSRRIITPDEADPPPPGYQYLGVLIRVQNRGSQTETVSSAIMFSLRDSVGQAMQQTFVIGGGPYLDGSVPPGGNLQAEIVYEIPTGTAGLQIVFTPGFVGSSSVVLL